MSGSAFRVCECPITVFDVTLRLFDTLREAFGCPERVFGCSVPGHKPAIGRNGPSEDTVRYGAWSGLWCSGLA